jgi:transposase
MVAKEAVRVGDRIPDDYEIDDLVDAIIASRQPAVAKTPPPAIKANAPSLDGIDGVDEFDVDSIVNAIVTASRQPEPARIAPIEPPPARAVVAPPAARPIEPTPPRAPASIARPQWAETTPTPTAPGTPWTELTPSRLPPPTGSPFVERTPFGERAFTPREASDEPPLPKQEPPRRPPPRPDSRALAAEAATPPGPIDLSRVEQPTRPPVRPLQMSQPGSDGERDIPAGTVIGDRYRVVDLIGRGGVSVVYRVEHTLLLKRMALKVLRPELSQTPSVVDRKSASPAT